MIRRGHGAVPRGVPRAVWLPARSQWSNIGGVQRRHLIGVMGATWGLEVRNGSTLLHEEGQRVHSFGFPSIYEAGGGIGSGMGSPHRHERHHPSRCSVSIGRSPHRGRSPHGLLCMAIYLFHKWREGIATQVKTSLHGLTFRHAPPSLCLSGARLCPRLPTKIVWYAQSRGVWSRELG